MSKQDRQPARTPTDLERKYNIGGTFSETGKSNAKRDAQLASLSQTLSQFMTSTNAALEAMQTIGTSGIWTYRKWDSGIAECWAVVASKPDALTFPVTFEGDPCVQVTEYNSKFHYFVIGKIKAEKAEEGGE